MQLEIIEKINELNANSIRKRFLIFLNFERKKNTSSKLNAPYFLYLQTSNKAETLGYKNSSCKFN